MTPTFPLICRRCGFRAEIRRRSTLAGRILVDFGEICPRCGGRMEIERQHTTSMPSLGVKNPNQEVR